MPRDPNIPDAFASKATMFYMFSGPDFLYADTFFPNASTYILCGIEPMGITATNDVEALLALKPDVVVYNPMWIDVDELVRILSAGGWEIGLFWKADRLVGTLDCGESASASPLWGLHAGFLTDSGNGPTA